MLLKTTDKSKKILSLILSVVIVFGVMSVSAFALTDAEKQEYENKIEEIKNQIKENEKKIAELEAEAATYDDEISALQEKIDVLSEQIDLYNSEIALIDADIKVIDNQITGIENEIEDLNKQIKKLDEQVMDIQQQIADTYTLLGERIRVSYMTGANTTLEYLLTSDNFKFQEYLERTELIERIAQHDDKLITDLEDDIESLKAKVLEISTIEKLFCDGEKYFTHTWGMKQQMREDDALRYDFCKKCIRRISDDFPDFIPILAKIPELKRYFEN